MNTYKNFCLSLLVLGLVLVGGFIFSVPKAHAVASNVATNIEVTPGAQFTIFKGVPVYRLIVTNSGGSSDTITSLSPTPSGNVVDTTVTLHFYHDVNNNGIVDQGDINLHASGNFGADNAFTIFNIDDVTVPAAGSASILITADVGAGVGAQTFNLSFAAGTDIVMTSSAIATSGWSPLLNDAALTVTNTAPSLTIADGPNNHGPHTATPNQTGVVVKQLSITTAAAGTADSIVSLAITPDGSEDDTNVSNTKFYIDSGITPGAIDSSDIILDKSPATYTVNNGKKVFTFTSPIQIAGNSSVKILYTYDLGAGVVGGRTLTAQLVDLGDAVAGSGVPVATNNSTVSDTITIATTAIITISSAKITGPNQITVGFNPGAGTMSATPITAFAAGALVLTSGSDGARTIDSLVSLSGNTAVYTFGGAAVALNETAILTVTTPTDITDTGGNTFDGVGYRRLSISDGQAPVITSVVITAGAYKIGSVIPVNITTSADADTYTAGAITINGHTMGSFASAGSYIYTGTYTVVSGDVDRASVGVIPVSVILTDTALSPNSNVAYTTAPTSGGTVTIDANVPTVTTTVSQLHITATDNGNPFDVILTFSEPMNTGIYPTISFSENVIGSGLLTFVSPSLGSWSDLNKIFTQEYTINGLISENFAGVDVTVGGGTDYPAGNVMATTNTADLFDVNTLIVSTVVVPTLTTEDTATEITRTTATTGGAIIDLGGENAFERGFKYGLTLEYENHTTETDSFGATEFTVDLTNLSCSKTYHYQSYASNSAGTGYGPDQTFKTSGCSSSGGGSLPTFTPATPAIPATQSEGCASSYSFSVVTGKPCSTSFTVTSLPTSTSCSISIYGSTGELVKEKTRGINAKGVQNAINQLKATTLPLATDGIIGPLSEAGIKNAQKILLVTTDGIWGPKTQQAYELFIKKQCPAV